MAPDTPDLSVVIPVYRSAEFVAGRLGALCEFLDAHVSSYEVIAVDDASPDDSAARVAGLDHPRVELLRRERNEGKYAAIAAGVARSRGRCVIFTDADVPYELDIVPQMLHLVLERGFHLVIGDRTLPDSRYSERLPPLRAAATRLFTVFVRLFVTGGVPDTQCGIKGFRGDVARSLFPVLHERGFAGDVELLYVALKYNLSIRRLPARLVYAGHSTVRPLRDGLAMLRALVSLRRRHRAGAHHSPELEALGREDYPS